MADENKLKYGVNFNEYKTPSQSELGLSDAFTDRYNSALSTYDPDSVQDSILDKVANFFGIRSSADKMRDQINLARQQALNQLVNQQAEQEYNSEASKAERMRDAGLNPDLLGLGDASEATEGNEPESSPDFSQLAGFQDMCNTFTSAFSNTLQLFSGIQAFQLNGIDISSRLYDLNDKLQGKSIDILKKTLSSDTYWDFLRSSEENGSISPAVVWTDDLLKSYGLRSKRERKFFRDYVSNLRNTYAGELQKYSSYSDYLKSQDDFLNLSTSWYRDKDNPTSLAPARNALKIWNDYVHNVTEFQYKYAYSYYSKADGSLKALHENNEHKFQSAFWSKVNSDSAAGVLNSQNKYNQAYFNGLDANVAAGAFNESKKLEKFFAEQKQSLIRRLLLQRDPFSTILVTQILSGVNPLQAPMDVLGGITSPIKSLFGKN